VSNTNQTLRDKAQTSTELPMLKQQAFLSSPSSHCCSQLLLSHTSSV